MLATIYMMVWSMHQGCSHGFHTRHKIGPALSWLRANFGGEFGWQPVGLQCTPPLKLNAVSMVLCSLSGRGSFLVEHKLQL